MNIKNFFQKKIFMFLSFIILVGFVIYFIRNSNKYIELFANDQENVSIIATCPSGYKQYTDKPGNSVCCAGKIDYIASTCEGKACTLHTKVEDPNKPGMFYEKCISK